ncbi:MAG: SpoIIE family protein phosphatase [Phycisphaerales bacterium]|nr:MAG: SpoIIE family protein phosphatase [Phycisphaerales bacterium]
MDRIHDELHLAATVQRELIPVQLPKVAGMELGVIFRPVNYVSGDVYAVELLDVEHLGFFVADAVGHGVPAALLTMALCHNLVTREFTGEGLGTRIIDPADVLARLNLKLCESRQNSSRFATAVYGVVHIPSRRVTIAGLATRHRSSSVTRIGAKSRPTAHCLASSPMPSTPRPRPCWPTTRRCSSSPMGSSAPSRIPRSPPSRCARPAVDTSTNSRASRGRTTARTSRG